ncbi:hypothetical protein C8R45DRAFT_1020988 [Mycena sanguinolenta]|nr:hypothetical protein C8R45DRAFT_483793 [Mycena sanguinolenta]KAJ6466246.1 hypothetical protein C8R45DRAFT_1020988 [Mycena sanguinolenta]
MCAHPASDRQRRGKARGLQRVRTRVEKFLEAGIHVPPFRVTLRMALSQQDQNPSEIADICELRMSKCRMRSMLHEAGRARAQSLDGTPAQRVVHVKHGWCDVRASTGKRGTATHDLHHAGKCPLCRTFRTATCKREPPKYTSPQLKKQVEFYVLLG